MHDYLALASIPETEFEALLSAPEKSTTEGLVRHARQLDKRRPRRVCCPHCGGDL
jgi:hypothetical protein